MVIVDVIDDAHTLATHGRILIAVGSGRIHEEVGGIGKGAGLRIDQSGEEGEVVHGHDDLALRCRRH